jgi:ATP-dependent Clp protease ATP-binding subunit ClpB
VDFRNTVVIMTSNLGSQYFREEKDPQRVRGLIMDLLKQALRPEFLNRIDEIVIFQPLGREEIASIVEIQARHLVKRLADKRVTLELSPAAKALLAQEGYDPVYGARPLKRTIQRMIQDPLALELLNGTFGEGDTVVADVDHGKVVFRKTAEARPA